MVGWILCGDRPHERSVELPPDFYTLIASMKSAFLPLWLLSVFVLLTAAFGADLRPNILLIMADDMGFSDIGCYGSEIKTPNLDRLAAEGVRFTQFYNNAKCTTTRASLLSGMYPRHSGNAIPLEIPTVGEVMRGLGYQTGMSGKWHLGPKAPQRPIDRGFDEYYGLMDGACNYFNPAQPDPEAKNSKVRIFGHNDTLITEFPKDYYTTDAFATHASDTMRRFHAAGKPFFIHLAFNAPHYPLHAFPADIAKYRGKYRAGWEELRRQRHARQLAMGLLDPQWALSGTDEHAYDWSTAHQDWEDLRMATYAAMVDRMDQNIGRLLATLKELGIENDTVVMFLSDNGGCAEEPGGRNASEQPGLGSTYTAVGPAWGWAQNTPFRHYKSFANEGGISTPFIVRWPGRVKAGTMTGEVGHIIDVLPTCLAIAGAKYPAEWKTQATAPVEGRSLLPVLQGGTRAAHDAIFWEWAGNGAMRQGPWKLVWDTLNQARQWQLYDVAKDRTELHDLATQQPARVAAMRSAYEAWAQATDRAMPGQEKRKKSKRAE
jgi:arylsulfatase A-like enzyme